MPRPRGRAPKPEVLDREAQVVSLRRQGHTWQEIATETGYASPSGAADAYYRASVRVVSEDIELLRQLENDRLDALHAAVWEQAISGDLKSVSIAIKISERRSKLLGLDVKVDSKITFQQSFPDASEINDSLVQITRALEYVEKNGINLDADSAFD